MFENILIGQYIDTGSVLHRLDARLKIIITVILAVMLFCADKYISVIYIMIVCAMLVRLSGIKIRILLKSMKAVLFLAVFTLVFNAFFTEGRELLAGLTYEGLSLGVISALRLLLLVASASVLTLTTKPVDLTDAVESLLKPLEKIKVPVSDIAVMTGLALRFVPTLGAEARQIIDAQKSRGADFEAGGIIKKAKAVLPLIIPLFAGAFRHSEALADAMDARCYGMGRRTRMREQKLKITDLYAVVIFAVITAIFVGVELL